MCEPQPERDMNDSISRWRKEGVRVVRAKELDEATAQTLGMQRRAAITTARTGAKKLWAGTVTIEAKAKTGAHHHGDLESVIYVVNGVARLRWGIGWSSSRMPRRGISSTYPICAPPGDQCQPGSAAALRPGAQRTDRAGLQPGYRAGGDARAGPLVRRSAPIGLRPCHYRMHKLRQS